MIKTVFGNRKIMLGAMTMALILAIIVVSSFWPFIIDPSKIGTDEFVTDQLLNMAITISSTISMMFISQASNAADERSELARSKVEFKKSMERIKERTPFYQWVQKVLQPQDRADIARKGMERIGADFAVFSLDDAEIKTLTEPQKIGEKYFKALEPWQIKQIIALKKKVKSTRFVAPNYYTTYKSWAIDKNLSQIAASENAKKVSTVVFELTLKIVTAFTGAAILASLVRDLTQQGGSTAQAWMRFLSRMFAFVTSSFLGYLLGSKLNDIDAFYITKRCEVHSLYLEDKDFVPVDEAKIEYEGGRKDG